ncbi:serine/threonine-protein kinase [Arthrobacter sp. NPDC090010]|uniref:serine/threonine-protein kinase n=1 Tax=Arthrobacter sp. NPDC090010 TaxID=3363942 RepID=UPI00381AB8FE
MSAHLRKQSADDGEDVPRVEGYRTRGLLGSGGTSEVWLLEGSDGTRSALKTPRSAGDGGRPESLRAERWRQNGISHEHLLAVHRVVTLVRSAGDGALKTGEGLLMDFAPGGTVASLVAARGRITPEETVTVIVPIARALAYLHARGLVHGDVAPGNILFSAEGKPLLSDFGLARIRGEEERGPLLGTAPFVDTGRRARRGDAGRAAADVYSLAAVAWWCLTGEAPGPSAYRPPLPVIRPEVPRGLALAVEAGLQEEPDERVTAEAFARAVQRACRALPVRIAAGAHPGMGPELVTTVLPEPPGGVAARLTGLLRALKRPRAHSRRAGGRRAARRRRRPGIGAAVTAASVALLTGLSAVHNGRSASTTTPPSQTSPQAVPDPVAAVPELVESRARMLQDRDESRLSSVYVPGRAMDRDRVLLRALRTQGRHYAGYRPTASSTKLLRRGGSALAEVRATLTTPGFSIVADRPGNGRGVPAWARGSRVEEVLLALTLVEGRWRIQEVSTMPSGSP